VNTLLLIGDYRVICARYLGLESLDGKRAGLPKVAGTVIMIDAVVELSHATGYLVTHQAHQLRSNSEGQPGRHSSSKML
jgi:hypothetical protein